MAIIDASVYVALINSEEAEHTSSWNWFEATQRSGEQIVSPVILLAEVASAVSRGISDPHLARRVIEQLIKTSMIELIPISQSLAERAAAIASDHRIRGCDAIYVALAALKNESLVTLDKRQLERGSAIVEAHKPSDFHSG